MANYPTSNPSFGTKNTGDVVQATHINALQDEVVAIGSALRTTLQHAVTISSGGLTLSTGNASLGQNLSVAGASTLATLQVSGGSTFAGPVTFSSGVTFAGTVLPTVPVCVVTNSTLIAVANNAETGLNWDTQIKNPHGMHSTASNSSRITFAYSTGEYEVGVQLTWAAASSGSQIIRIRQNDSSGVAANPAYFATAGNLDDMLVTQVRAASTTDFVTVRVTQVSGSTKSITNASTTASLKFWARFVSL